MKTQPSFDEKIADLKTDLENVKVLYSKFEKFANETEEELVTMSHLWDKLNKNDKILKNVMRDGFAHVSNGKMDIELGRGF